MFSPLHVAIGVVLSVCLFTVTLSIQYVLNVDLTDIYVKIVYLPMLVWAFDWNQNQCPWITLNGRNALLRKNFYGAQQKTLNEDRHILSAAKCRPMIPVLEKMTAHLHKPTLRKRRCQFQKCSHVGHNSRKNGHLGYIMAKCGKCVFLIYISLSVIIVNSSSYIKVELNVTLGVFDTPLPLNAPTL